MGALPAHSSGLLGSGIFCLILALVFIIKVSVPHWRTKWGWGRVDGYSISVLGHIGISVGFLLISIGCLATYFDIQPDIALFLPLAGFAIFIIAGLLDRARSKEGWKFLKYRCPTMRWSGRREKPSVAQLVVIKKTNIQKSCNIFKGINIFQHFLSYSLQSGNNSAIFLDFLQSCRYLVHSLPIID